MKKAIIIPGITDLNRGDQSLVWLIKDMLESAGVSLEYRLLQNGINEDVYKQSNQSINLGYKLITPILLHPGRGKSKRKFIGYSMRTKIAWGLTAISDIIKSSLLLSKKRFLISIGLKFLNQKQKRAYQEFEMTDILFVKGGGFLHSYNRLTDLYYLYYSLYHIILAKKLNKKIIVMPNSFGPFLGKWEKKIIKKVMRNCDLIYARESISQKYLSSMLDNQVKLSPDLGFYIKEYINESNKTSNVLSSNNNVAVTMRPYRFPEESNGKDKYDQYIKEMYKVTRGLIDRGFHPVFVAHTLGPSAHEDDRIAIKSVIELLRDSGISDYKYTYFENPEMNCYDITQLYSQMNFIIGTRFHSVIFAMTSRVPAIAISYSGNKTKGIMEDMDLSEYTIEMANVSEEVLLNKFDKLNANKESVKTKIDDYLRKCNIEKDNLIDQVRKQLAE